MPMWISWVNPTTGKRERIYNYGDPEAESGKVAVRFARRCLAERFGVPEDEIAGFDVESAPWLPPSVREKMVG